MLTTTSQLTSTFINNSLTFGIGNNNNNKIIIISREVAATTRPIIVNCSLEKGLLAVVVAAAALSISSDETFLNVPQTLSSECAPGKECKKERIQRPKSSKAEKCTSKCVTTCIRGGEGSPGVGPLNIRGPLVVFKEGFRSRRYCLVECSDICNLIGDGDDGP